MKLLIIGCGSIGRRHALNAQKLGAEVVLCDTNEDRMRELGQEVGASQFFTDYAQAAMHSGAHAAVVATPSNFHIPPARALVAAGVHILMEKPLCTSAPEAVDLGDEIRQSGLVLMMAHTYRFRAEWLEIKRILSSQPLGRVYSAEFMGGWYLPDWHIFEQYQHEYAAQKKLGGGTLLTSLSHFFDVVSWLFGDIERIAGAQMRLSDLEIDVDDSVTCVLRTKSGAAITLVEDFLCRCPRRSLRVNADHGYFEADFNRKTLSIWDSRKKRFSPLDARESALPLDGFKILEDGVAYDLSPEVSQLQYSGNDAYLAELEFFFKQVESGVPRFNLDIDAGIKVLEALNSPQLQDWTH
jgi:predicted dehydrogenase